MQIQNHVPLASFTTFRVGGPARFFVRVRSREEVAEARSWAEARSAPVLVLGGGTNVLVADEGFPGLVIKIENSELEIRPNGSVAAGAGVPMGRVVQEAAKAGLSGLEWAAGLPGTVGGAIFGNAGAFGYETGEFAREVSAITPMGELRTYKSHPPMQLRGVPSEGEGRRSNPEGREGEARGDPVAIVRDPSLRPGRGSASDRFASLAMTEGEFDGFRFRYRWSSFKDWPGFIIMSAVFALQAGQKSEIQAAMKTVMASRHAHQPLPEQSAGCIFKNPSADEAAGKLIDECGLKGMRVGGAEVSLRHANFIVNTGSATAQDIRKLIQIVKDHVKKEMGIVLEEEVRYLCENHEL